MRLSVSRRDWFVRRRLTVSGECEHHRRKTFPLAQATKTSRRCWHTLLIFNARKQLESHMNKGEVFAEVIQGFLLIGSGFWLIFRQCPSDKERENSRCLFYVTKHHTNRHRCSTDIWRLCPRPWASVALWVLGWEPLPTSPQTSAPNHCLPLHLASVKKIL